MRDKVIAAEKSKVYVNFFNRHTLKLIKKSKSLFLTDIAPTEILSELAIRAFTGSRDVPKDHIKALKLFDYAQDNSVSPEDHAQSLYYQLLMRKFKIHQETILRGIQMTPELEQEMVEINTKLNDLAQKGEE
jgi:hypothetical protein